MGYVSPLLRTAQVGQLKASRLRPGRFLILQAKHVGFQL